MTKTIDTLVEDIYELFNDGVIIPDEASALVSQEIAEVFKARMAEAGRERVATLRMSNLGKPDRQLWYEHHGKRLGLAGEKLAPPVKIKFMFGDVWEALLLALAEAAGHTVEHKQAEVEINGIKGHNDAIIDGVVVDVKSASKFAFQKFASGSLEEDDPFGYMEQLAGYCTAHGGLDGAFLVVEKTLGKLCLVQYSYEDDLKPLRIEERAEHLKQVVASETMPERCYAPVPEGKAGNETLGINCQYCPWKFDCWSDANDGMGLRTFLYSTGPKHFTTVAKEPRVQEITF